MSGVIAVIGAAIGANTLILNWTKFLVDEMKNVEEKGLAVSIANHTKHPFWGGKLKLFRGQTTIIIPESVHAV
jgi:hypothetical protein